MLSKEGRNEGQLLKVGRRTTLILLCMLLAAGLGALYRFLSSIQPDVVVTGVVLTADQNPDKQVPVFDAKIIATMGEQAATARSDSAGYFKLSLSPHSPRKTITLTVQHPDFRPFELALHQPNQLPVIRLTKVKEPASNQRYDGAALPISNLRLRYTVKETNTVNIGSIVRSFEVPNKGNAPCANAPVCSPDGRWRASISSITYDAGPGNYFTNVRSSCVSGPCVFTQVDGSNIGNPGRYIHITIRNWSDTVTFLVEAEVSRTMETDMVRQSFPATFGTTMEFTLPPTAEGPSIEAELGGTNVLFPLGPSLLLSWATCRQETSPDRAHLYRCELKPSFVFH